MRFVFVVFALIGLGVCQPLPTACAADKILRLYQINPVDDPLQNPTAAMARVFSFLVASFTNGSIAVEMVHKPDTMPSADLCAMVARGELESGIFTAGQFQAVYPMLELLDLPFSFPNISTTYKVFDGPFGKKLADSIQEKTGMKVLGFGDSGGQYMLTTTKTAVRVPDDMKGLTIRTMPTQTHRLFVQALGAKPVSIPFSKLKEDLANGLADGQMNPLTVISFAGLAEVQHEACLTDHFFSPYVWVINQRFFNSLQPKDRLAIENAAQSAIVAGRGLSRIIEASDRGMQALASQMNIQRLTPAQRSMFRTLTVPAIKHYLLGTYGEEGKSMLEAYQAAIDEAEAHP